jgi:hypothetical protein
MNGFGEHSLVQMNGVLEEQGEMWTHCCGEQSPCRRCPFEHQELAQMHAVVEEQDEAWILC